MIQHCSCYKLATTNCHQNDKISLLWKNVTDHLVDGRRLLTPVVLHAFNQNKYELLFKKKRKKRKTFYRDHESGLKSSFLVISMLHAMSWSCMFHHVHVS